MKSSLSSLFLFFLAGQFFSPFFAFINSSTFWQKILPFLNVVYHEKEKNSNSFHRNQSRVSKTGCDLHFLAKTCQFLAAASNLQWELTQTNRFFMELGINVQWCKV